MAVELRTEPVEQVLDEIAAAIELRAAPDSIARHRLADA